MMSISVTHPVCRVVQRRRTSWPLASVAGRGLAVWALGCLVVCKASAAMGKKVRSAMRAAGCAACLTFPRRTHLRTRRNEETTTGRMKQASIPTSLSPRMLQLKRRTNRSRRRRCARRALVRILLTVRHILGCRFASR